MEQLDTKTTYQYVLDLLQRLEDTCALAHQELQNAQKKQKWLHDRNTKPPKIESGDKVLVFLPTDNNRLLLQWKGPYDVLERVARNDYKVRMADKDRVLHAKMIKLYYPRPQPDGSKKVATMLIHRTEDEED